MAASNFLIDALDQRRRRYQAQVKAVRKCASEEAVHDLRSSIRRLRAALEAVIYLPGQRRAEKLSGDLKQQMNATDDLRDTQVLLAGISRDLQQLPDLYPIEQSLKAREARMSRAAEKAARDIDLSKMEKRLLQVGRSLRRLSRQQLSDGLMQAADDAYSDAIYHYAVIDPGQPASLHQVRIALRKFRYLLEIIQHVFPGIPAYLLEHIHTYQDLMGEIQDGTLFMELAQNSLASESVPVAVQDFYGRRMTGAFSSYLPVKGQIHTFWRSTPRERFPWGQQIQMKGQRHMDLYIIRHAIAVESGAPGYEDDSQRPLTGKGRRKMKKIARGIGSLGVDFDCVISSPYVRARETAEILVDELKLKDKLVFSDALVPPGDFDRLVHEISEKNDLNSLALVGHEPMLSQFIGWLSTGGGGMSLVLKKGGLAYLTADDLAGTHRATLQWLLSPAAMVAING